MIRECTHSELVDQVRLLRIESELGKRLLARAHGILEMNDNPPKHLLAEIAFHLGWTVENMATVHKRPDTEGSTDK